MAFTCHLFMEERTLVTMYSRNSVCAVLEWGNKIVSVLARTFCIYGKTVKALFAWHFLRKERKEGSGRK